MVRHVRHYRLDGGARKAACLRGDHRFFRSGHAMLKIRLDALLTVDTIARRGSSAGAAKELFRVPPTISYTVSKLEEDLGVPLFERFGPRVGLTAAGADDGGLTLACPIFHQHFTSAGPLPCQDGKRNASLSQSCHLRLLHSAASFHCCE
jgi:hypothetical protein